MRLTRYEYFEAKGDDPDGGPSPFANEADFAYFAVQLGWTYDQYASHTPVQLAFVRKEIESRTVRDAELLRRAVEVALGNALGGRRAHVLARRAGEYDESAAISRAEIGAIKRQMERGAPWTPWQGVRPDGRLRAVGEGDL